jgi:thiol:disulfide interchange protein
MTQGITLKTIVGISCLLVISGSMPTAADPPKANVPKLYDEKADGNVQITKALAEAKRTRKNVLLQFGANWCGWCYKLHGLMEKDKTIAATLKKNYVLVPIDVVDQKHNADVVKKYENPVRFGLPVLVVLNKDGKMLTTQDTAKLEEGDHHDPKKVLAFLRQWTPKN